jgi:hypothetical protein
VTEGDLLRPPAWLSPDLDLGRLELSPALSDWAIRQSLAESPFGAPISARDGRARGMSPSGGGQLIVP